MRKLLLALAISVILLGACAAPTTSPAPNPTPAPTTEPTPSPTPIEEEATLPSTPTPPPPPPPTETPTPIPPPDAAPPVEEEIAPAEEETAPIEEEEVVPAEEEEEIAPPDETAALPPDPYVRFGTLGTGLASRKATQYHWQSGILSAATVYVVVGNRGGAGSVEVIFEVENEEIAREIVHLESGEEKQITTTIPLSKYRYESVQELKLNVTAIPTR